MNWKVRETYTDEFCKNFPEWGKVTLQLLWNRNLKSQEKIDEFFNPDYGKDLHDPFLFEDMEKATLRIEEAIRKGEKIVVHGDYDADGMTAATILKEAISKMGGKITGFIPNRYEEGYGLSSQTVESFSKQGVQLLITCDCGISNFDEVALANKKGIDVIITDHHHVPEKVPEALAIIHPRIEGTKYPDKELAGVGVAFKLACGVLEKMDFNGVVRGWEKWFLDLVALGTIADCSSLLGENRTLVKYGLVVLSKTRRLGLRKIMRKAGIWGERITPYEVGFIIAPRINASSRMGEPLLSFDLLNTTEDDEAVELAWRLDQSNIERDRVTREIIADIKKRLGAELESSKFIFDAKEDWKEGVLGLVAGKLVQEYGRPAVVFTKDLKKGVATGSVRSIEGFDAVENLEKVKNLIVAFGGHKGAAGLSVKIENLEKLKEGLVRLANENLTDEDLVPTLWAVGKISHKEIDWETLAEILRFEPFGMDNERPLFLIEKLKIKEMKKVGNGEKHLKMKLETLDGRLIDTIAFGMGKSEIKVLIGDEIDVMAELDENNWNGHKMLQLKVKDFRLNV